MKRGAEFTIIALAILLALCMATILVACNDGDEQGGYRHRHEDSEWIIDVEPTCIQQGHIHAECRTCHKRLFDQDVPASGQHTWKAQITEDNQKECALCGYKELVYEERDGKIYFGEYPQTKVEDDGIISVLNGKSGDRPVAGNSGKWTDYGYYIGGSASEYMWYIDIEYENAKYRGVYFTSYRPDPTTYGSSTLNSYQDDYGYYINALYWFKWEPIEWRVLERTDRDVFLMSNVILDSRQYYYSGGGTRSIDGKTVYPNNYKESDIRAWLNDTFYEQAFDKVDKTIIKTTLVDNSATTTADSSNTNACENTYDKVFLLSYEDVTNTMYGFRNDGNYYDLARRLRTTDYAQSQGAYTATDGYSIGDGLWWLRSPYAYNHSDAFIAYSIGGADSHCGVNSTYCGVVPAIKITL